MADKDESETNLASERLENIVDEAALDTTTLAGDIRDTLLDLFKTRPKPWSKMVEDEQQDVARALEYAARELVNKTVEIVKAAGKDNPVKAILEGYADKGDIKATVKVKTVGDDEALAAVAQLHQMRGKLILLTLASPADYMGERSPADTDPDQAPLFAGGTDPAGDDDLDPPGE
jgi:hypothetical protein